MAKSRSYAPNLYFEHDQLIRVCVVPNFYINPSTVAWSFSCFSPIVHVSSSTMCWLWPRRMPRLKCPTDMYRTAIRLATYPEQVVVVPFLSSSSPTRSSNVSLTMTVPSASSCCPKGTTASVYVLCLLSSFLCHFHSVSRKKIHKSVQVSRLVILHEEAEDGNAMPDLTRPVGMVSKAVANLIDVSFSFS